MARYLMLWRANPAALPLMPKDPSESLKMHEQWFAGLKDLIKKGVLEEFGFFPDSREACWAGYSIGKGEAADITRTVWMHTPFALIEIHEIIPLEKGKEITMALVKAMIEAAKK